MPRVEDHLIIIPTGSNLSTARTGMCVCVYLCVCAYERERLKWKVRITEQINCIKILISKHFIQSVWYEGIDENFSKQYFLYNLRRITLLCESYNHHLLYGSYQCFNEEWKMKYCILQMIQHCRDVMLGVMLLHDPTLQWSRPQTSQSKLVYKTFHYPQREEVNTSFNVSFF